MGDDFVLRSWVQLLLWKYFGFSPFGYRNEVKKVPPDLKPWGAYWALMGLDGKAKCEVRSGKKRIIRSLSVQSTNPGSLGLNGP